MCTDDKGRLLLLLTSDHVTFLYSLHLFSPLSFSFSLPSILATAQLLSVRMIRWSGRGEEAAFLSSSGADIQQIFSRIGDNKENSSKPYRILNSTQPKMSYYRYITGVYKSYWPELNRTLRSSSVPRHVPEAVPSKDMNQS